MSPVKYDSHSSLLFAFEYVTFYCPKCKIAYVIFPKTDLNFIAIVPRKEKDFANFSSILGLTEKEEQ